MANKPFDYTIINPLERPTSSDINQLQAQAHYDSRVLANQLFAGEEGFLGDSYKAVPYPVPSEGFSLTSGVLYSQGGAEDNIGGVSGLSDSYNYKATYLGYRAISAPNPPTTSGFVRYDMLAIRPLSGTERMVDPAVIGKFNPSLKSFTEQEVPKTLTASLGAETVLQQIPYSATGTEPFVYKTGEEIEYPGDWDLVPKPDPDAGYFAVVYIRRFEGQTEINTGVLEDARTLLTIPSAAISTVPVVKGGTGEGFLPVGEILLGNGTNSITSVAVLPMSKGGTGRAPTSADFNGSVAYLDSVTDQIKYTQALGGLYDTPVSGHLLSSNASGAPTWIAPGAAGQVLTSTGTAWESESPYYYSTSSTEATSQTITTTSWSLFADLDITGIALRAGLVRVRLQPRATGEDYRIRVFKAPASSTASVYLKFEIVDSSATTRSYVSKYLLENYSEMNLTMPAIEAVVLDDTYRISVYAKAETSGAPNTAGITIENCDLFVSQG